MDNDAFWHSAGPVLPVLTIHDSNKIVDIANALIGGGVKHLEVTLRTPAALPAISAVRERVPEMTVGAGTVVSRQDAQDAASAGAQFLVSPGTPSALLEAMTDTRLPLLPGAATPSEVLTLLQSGHRHIKLYPASLLGGSPYAKALGEPLQEARFVPSGGIAFADASEYLKLSNVAFVAGSWITTPELIDSESWSEIQRRARSSAALRG